MRRNLLAFAAGALIALAALLAVRSGDASSPARATPAAPGTAEVTATPQRQAHLAPRVRRARHTRAGVGSTAARARQDRSTPAAPATPAPTRTRPVTPAPAPAPTTTTTPADGSGGAPAPNPEPDPTTTQPSGGGSGGQVTIPNPATPDSSVGQPGG